MLELEVHRHMPRNLWRTWERANFPLSGLELYLPLWHPELSGATIVSKDLNAHSCTVVGALWSTTGRWFDKIDDIIVVPDHTAIQNIFDSSGGTIVAWINPASVGEGTFGRIWDKVGHFCYLATDSGSGTCKTRFQQNFDGINGAWNTTNYDVTYLKPQMVSISYNNSAVGNDPVICIDGNPVAITEADTPVGTKVSDADNPLNIGNRTATDRTFDGYINALWAFKGVLLTADQLQNIYNKTKWRYQ